MISTRNIESEFRTSKSIHECRHTTICHFKKWITTWKFFRTTQSGMLKNMCYTCIVFWCCLKCHTEKKRNPIGCQSRERINPLSLVSDLQTLFLCSRSICKCWQPVSLCWSLIAVRRNSGTGVICKMYSSFVNSIHRCLFLLPLWRHNHAVLDQQKAMSMAPISVPPTVSVTDDWRKIV